MAQRILIVDDEKDIRESLGMILREEGYDAERADSAEKALDLLAAGDIDILLCDIRMPGMDGIELLRRTIAEYPQTAVIMMTAYAAVESAIEALRQGAIDYLIKPIDFDDLLFRIARLVKQRQVIYENAVLRRRVHAERGFEHIIGKSLQMREVFRLIEKVSLTKGNVLITGKSGTGKELVARAIHERGERRDKIFLPVNCGAISPNLIESELFGHKKGAFTGAYQDKDGMFKMADGGTLFLDEIAEIPPHLQVKLLRAIEEKEILPVGSTRALKIDVRIISATNRDLPESVAAGAFREDLYYRLNVVEIKLPPLKERAEDIPLLVEHFIQKYNAEMGHTIAGVDNETMRVLKSHEWRGGVRELENIIERAVIFCEGNLITMRDLPGTFTAPFASSAPPDDLKEAVRAFERRHILEILRRTGSKEKTARALRIGLSSLYRKLDDLAILPEEYLPPTD